MQKTRPSLRTRPPLPPPAIARILEPGQEPLVWETRTTEVRRYLDTPSTLCRFQPTYPSPVAQGPHLPLSPSANHRRHSRALAGTSQAQRGLARGMSRGAWSVPLTLGMAPARQVWTVSPLICLFIFGGLAREGDFERREEEGGGGSCLSDRYEPQRFWRTNELCERRLSVYIPIYLWPQAGLWSRIKQNKKRERDI